MSAAAIAAEGLAKRFHARRGEPDIIAVDDVSFAVPEGTTLGLVGESGSGKSTIARLVLGLLPADGGSIEVLGRQIIGARRNELRSWRSDMQIVFQEPYESLDPRMKVGDAVAEPLVIHTELSKTERQARVRDLLEHVSLDPALVGRYPDQLSGGQQQRVNIARALATEPKVLVLDEPTSSLDVSVRADILKLLVQLQREFGLTYLLISHDLPTIRSVCDQVAVLYLVRLVEIGPAADVLSEPQHPYTEFLLGSELPLNPNEKPKGVVAQGEARSRERPEGCIFLDRCPISKDECGDAQPPLTTASPEHDAACVWVGSERPQLQESEA
ncbi:MAG: oligopeptide/dipeptide ABC transporter ATP-binding protein [Gaiellaceae bacterium]